MNNNLKLALAKSAVVLVPSYAAAYFTGQMVYVVPTLAAAGFFASTIEFGAETASRRVEQEVEDTHSAPVHEHLEDLTETVQETSA